MINCLTLGAVLVAAASTSMLKVVRGHGKYAVPVVADGDIRVSNGADDVVVTAVTGGKGPVDVFLYSLRSVGFGGRIVILCANASQLQWLSHAIMENSAEVFAQEAPNWRGSYFVRDRIRWYWLKVFLVRNENVRRIFMADGFDVFFNANPFRGRVNGGLEFYGEGLGKICHDRRVASWYDECEGAKEWRCSEMVCSGTVFGGRKEMMGLADVLVERVGKRGCRTDQGAISVEFFAGNLSRFGAIASLDGSHVMAWGYLRRFAPESLLAVRGAAVFHQWNRGANLTRVLYEACPAADPGLAGTVGRYAKLAGDVVGGLRWKQYAERWRRVPKWTRGRRAQER